MSWILSPSEIDSSHRGQIGPKGYALSLMIGVGLEVPKAVSLIHTGDDIAVEGYLGIVTAVKNDDMGNR